MADSLKDQMLALGLISKQQAARRPGKKTQAPKKQRGQKSQRQQELDAIAAHKREKDRAANREREIQRKAREQADWVRQIIATHALAREATGDDVEPFNFTLNGKIHRLHAKPDQRQRLVSGALGIVQFDGRYHLLPTVEVQRLAEKIAPRCWLPTEDEAPAEDDPYAEYKVPDDLVW